MIASLLTESIMIIRPRSEGEYIKGRFCSGGLTDEFCLKASVQPDTGEVLENAEENERTRETVTIFVLKELFTALSSPLKRPDVVVYNSKKYEVTLVERWAGLLPHYKVKAEELLDGGDIK